MEWWVWLLLIIVVVLVLLAIWWWWTRMRSTPAAPMATPRMEARPAPRTEAMAAPVATPEVAPAAPAPVAPAPSTGSDKLEVIEGIGPKIAGVLQAAGIDTFAQLAATDVMRLEQILRDANLPLAKPGSWPAQAQLAADGKWDELKSMQDTLKAGR